MKKDIPGFTTETKPAKVDTSGSVPKTPSQPIVGNQNGKGGFPKGDGIKPAKI